MATDSLSFNEFALSCTHISQISAEGASSDTPTLTLRGFTYQAVGQLAKRAPQLFQKDTDIAAQFFSALSVEPPGVRAALQEAVSTLAIAYKGCSGVSTYGAYVLPVGLLGVSTPRLMLSLNFSGVAIHD